MLWAPKPLLRPGYRTMYWFKIWKGICQGSILLPCLFNSYAEYIIWNARLDDTQAGIKIAGRNINNIRYADEHGRKWRGTKESHDECERGEGKSSLKTKHSKSKDHGIQSYHFMGGKWKQCQISFSWSPESMGTVTAAMKLKDACSLEEKLW